MRAMRITSIGDLNDNPEPLRADVLDVPVPAQGELLLRIHACGVCHTELDEIEGRTPPARLPLTPGHQVIGSVVAQGSDCQRMLLGKRVGVAWIHSACGQCPACRAGKENLCPGFKACGRDSDGGYAEYMTVSEDFAHAIPADLDSAAATPLLCAGAVGLRSLRLCGLQNGDTLGLTGFGASGHLVLQMARYLYPDSAVMVFARSASERRFARTLGASPAAIIDTTPAWVPVLAALQHLAPGGRLVINAIRKESADKGALAGLDYATHLWHEKMIRSVANVTRQDVQECLRLAVEIPLRPEVTRYPLREANLALRKIRSGNVRGAGVLIVEQPADTADLPA
jgi:propanol-preferring alcohol dehydrogenase